MADAVAGEGEDGGLGENSAALGFCGQGHFDEVGGRRVLVWGDGCESLCEGLIETVMLCEKFVHHAPVGVDEFAEGESLIENFSEKGFRFRDHAVFEAFVVIRIEFFIGLEHADFPQAKPLGGERVGEPSRFWVTDHALELRFEGGPVAQFSFFREAEEFGIGHGIPEQVREAGGDFPVIEVGASGVFIPFSEEEKALGVED